MEKSEDSSYKVDIITPIGDKKIWSWNYQGREARPQRAFRCCPMSPTARFPEMANSEMEFFQVQQMECEIMFNHPNLLMYIAFEYNLYAVSKG